MLTHTMSAEGEQGRKEKKNKKPALDGEYKKDGVVVRLHTFGTVCEHVPELSGLFAPGLEPGLEIEEQFEIKWVPSELYDISIDGIKDMTQGYVWLQANSAQAPKPIKVRIRAFADHVSNAPHTYRIVRKVGVEEGVDQEYEHDISGDSFASLDVLRSGARVNKTRFYIPHHYVERSKHGDRIYSCQVHLDVFRSVGGAPARFVRAEIEFPSTEVRNFFLDDRKNRLPEWIGRRVDKSKEREHASTYIALHGLPLSNGADVKGVDELYARLDREVFSVDV